MFLLWEVFLEGNRQVGEQEKTFPWTWHILKKKISQEGETYVHRFRNLSEIITCLANLISWLISGSGFWRKEGWWDCQKVRDTRKDTEVVRVRLSKV